MPPTPNYTGQKPSKPDIKFLLQGYQLPDDINFRRLYDAITILATVVDDLGLKVNSLIISSPISPLSIILPSGESLLNPEQENDRQIVRRASLYDINKRVSVRV